MKFKTLAQVRAHQFAGNHHSDHPAFAAIETFAQDTSHSMSDRAEALRIMGRDGMGLDPQSNGEEISDEQLIAEFFECRSEA